MTKKLIIFKITFTVAFFLLSCLFFGVASRCYNETDGFGCIFYIGFAILFLIFMIVIIALEDDKEGT